MDIVLKHFDFIDLDFCDNQLINVEESGPSPGHIFLN